MADQLRSLGSFYVFAVVPRDAKLDASDITAMSLMDCFVILCESGMLMLHLGLSEDVTDDQEPLRPISLLDA